MRSLRWTRWVYVLELDPKFIPSEPGVYELRWVNDKSKGIHRAGKVDKSGLLCVGQAGNLKKHVWNLARGIIKEKSQDILQDATTSVTIPNEDFLKTNCRSDGPHCRKNKAKKWKQIYYINILVDF